MRINIRFFATLRDRAGVASLQVEITEPATVADVLKQLVTEFPAIEPSIPTALVAVNQEYSFPDTVVHPGDEVALFPPVSGGSVDTQFPEYFEVTPDRLDFDSILATITRPETGAVCVFSGAVRGTTVASDQVRSTSRLEYESYIPMAEKALRQVAEEIRQKYPKVQGIAIVQRIGTLQVGETTIFVACAAGHRNDGCFEGARYGIDRVKEIVPVWKKEVGANGEFWVEGHYLPTPADVSREKSAETLAPEHHSTAVSREGDFQIGCPSCGRTYSLDDYQATCTCGGLLDVVRWPSFDPAGIDSERHSMWRYQPFLLPETVKPVTMGEGWTPLVPISAFGRAIYLKLENLNPTGAFKDRCASMLVSLLAAKGISAVHDDSSGNAGAALAAYAARAGLNATLYVPESASPVKLGQIRLYGAELKRVPGPRSAALVAAKEVNSGISSYASHIEHPFSVFAYKSIAFELWEQLGRRQPDAVVLPLGHGSQLIGLHLGFRDLLDTGLIAEMPRLFGVQSRACAPFWGALHGETPQRVETETLAEGIRIAEPVRRAQALKAITETNGDVLIVEEHEIREGIRELGRRGFAVEPTSAVIWSALAELSRRMPQEAVIVASITGSGLKYPGLDGLAAQDTAHERLNNFEG